MATEGRGVSDPRILRWTQRLQAIAQNGLFYCTEPFDRLRYAEVRQVAAEMMSAHSGEGLDCVWTRFATEEGHATPKIDVRAGLILDGRILLVREKEDGCWSLPGGWADVSDSPSRAAEREVWEEAGLRVQAVRLAALFNRQVQHPPSRFPTWRALFLCALGPGGEEFQPNVEVSAVGYFPPDDLPPLSRNRTSVEQVALMFAHYADPSLPTVFD